MIKIFGGRLAVVAGWVGRSQPFHWPAKFQCIAVNHMSCKSKGKEGKEKKPCPACEEYQYCPLCPPRGFDFIPPAKCEVFGDVGKKKCPEPCPKPPTCTDPPKPTDPCKAEPKKKEPCEKEEPKKDPCKKEEPKKDPCKKEEPKKDPCKKEEPKKDPCKKEEPKKDPCKKEEPKKEDKCKTEEPKKEDKCKTKEEPKKCQEPPKKEEKEKCPQKAETKESTKVSFVGGEPKRPPCPSDSCPKVPCDCCKVEPKDPAPKKSEPAAVCGCKDGANTPDIKRDPCKLSLSVKPCEAPPKEQVKSPEQIEPKPCPLPCSAGWTPKKPIPCPRPDDPCPRPRVPIIESSIPMPAVCDAPCPFQPKMQTGWPEKSAYVQLCDGEVSGSPECKDKKEMQCPKLCPPVNHLPPKLNQHKLDAIQKFLLNLFYGEKKCPPPYPIMDRPPCAYDADRRRAKECAKKLKEEKCKKPKGPNEVKCPGDVPPCKEKEKGVCPPNPKPFDPCDKCATCKKTNKPGVWRAEKRKFHLGIQAMEKTTTRPDEEKMIIKKRNLPPECNTPTTVECNKDNGGSCGDKDKNPKADLVALKEKEESFCKQESATNLMHPKYFCPDKCKKIDQCYKEEDYCCPPKEPVTCAGVRKGTRPPYENECSCYSRDNFYQDLEAATWIERIRRSIPATRPPGASCTTKPTALCPDQKTYCCPPGKGRPHTDLCPPTEPLVRPRPQWQPPAERPGPIPEGPPWSRVLRNGPVR